VGMEKEVMDDVLDQKT